MSSTTKKQLTATTTALLGVFAFQPTAAAKQKIQSRKAGTVENGTYSQGMKNSNITWNEGAFREFVSNPAAKVPGTTMLLSVGDEKEIGDLWAYLKQV